MLFYSYIVMHKIVNNTQCEFILKEMLKFKVITQGLVHLICIYF